MSYCLNPACPHPENLGDAKHCQQCDEVLRLHSRYLPLKPIGQGGFGRTFLAIDESRLLKPRCVIKQFLPQQQGTKDLEKAAELFRQEAQRLKELGEHPQIPDLLAYLEQHGCQYLIQEFIDGQNLTQELEEDGIFNEAKIRQLLNDLLPVVQYIHEHQVIHRDIKPANIIRRATDQKLFLVDLGAAKYATGTALAMTGTVIGSAEYTAPEQSRGKAVFASDLYSLGATCVHLLTGISPFDLYDSSEGRWIWLDYAPRVISELLSRTLNKMLEAPTNRRYQSANEILMDLEQLDQRQDSGFPTNENFRQPSATSKYASKPSNSADFKPRLEEQSALINANFEAGGKLAPIEQTRAPQKPSLIETSPRPTNLRTSSNIAVMIFLIALMFVSGFFMVRSFLLFLPHDRSHISDPRWSIGLPPNDDEPGPKFTNPVQPTQVLAARGQVVTLTISPDSRTLVSGNDDSRASTDSGVAEEFHDSNLQVWDLTTGRNLHTLTSHHPVFSVAISPDGKTLASQSINISTNPETLNGIELSDDEQERFRGTLQLWNFQTGELLRTLAENTFGASVKFSPDGEFLAGSSFGQIYIWNVATGETLQTLQARSDSVSFNPSDNTLLTATSPVMGGTISPEVQVWDWRTGEQINLLSSMNQDNTLDRNGFSTLAVSQNGLLVLGYKTRSRDLAQPGSAIKIWSLQTSPAELVITQNIPLDLAAVAVSPDGSLVAAAGTQDSVETVNIYETQTGELIRSLSGSSKLARSVVFTPNGQKLITGSIDGVIRVWNIEELR
ncbi:serine/threonine protein kinase [Leptolyngbya sp. FACHB-541]|uniref:serine/threonine-protein kinase n=1 Tax=Leptolyngbya sp. FACHB-541 TaxID=2692810 RepID=UPI0016888473|nr:serine/threonine-protein kinase [Leptolyngbya sp. FACHB-541]MBD1999073.1 serine/threonine protein kinase [Leptolyngbya sp. FACHB-541]